MFAEQRAFRGIALRFPGNDHPGALRTLLSSDAIRNGDLIDEWDGCYIQHLVLRSTSRFTISPLLEQVRVPSSEPVTYDYDLYILRLVIATGTVAIIAVPFRSMYSEILPIIVENAPAGGISYEVLQLSRAVEMIIQGHHEGGLLSITAYEALVEGDPNVRILQMTGPDTIHSDVYGVFRASKRFRLSPRRCTFSYDDHAGTAIQLTADRYGNFSFRVAARARNLSAIAVLVAFFARNQLMRTTWSSPFDRIEPGETNEELETSSTY